MPTLTPPTAGDDLRRARLDAGLTRTQLAALSGCSMSALFNIEAGAVPRRSRVLEEAFAAIAAYNEKRPAGQPSASTIPTGGAVERVRSE